MLKVRDRIFALLHDMDEKIVDNEVVSKIKDELHEFYTYLDLGIDIIKNLTHSIIESVSKSDFHMTQLQKEILKQAFFKFLEENEIETEYFEEAFKLIESRLAEKSQANTSRKFQ